MPCRAATCNTSRIGMVAISSLGATASVSRPLRPAAPANSVVGVGQARGPKIDCLLEVRNEHGGRAGWSHFRTEVKAGARN